MVMVTSLGKLTISPRVFIVILHKFVWNIHSIAHLFDKWKPYTEYFPCFHRLYKKRKMVYSDTVYYSGGMPSDFVDREKRKRTMKKSLLALLAALCLLLWGCSDKDNPPQEAVLTPPVTAPTAAPATQSAPAEASAAPEQTIPEQTAPAETAAPAESADTSALTAAPGVYTYQSPDALWTLTLRDNGPYTLQKDGDIPHTGEAWAPNEDGTISCGPTDLWTEVFADSNGCSRWSLYSDGRCEPVIPG